MSREQQSLLMVDDVNAVDVTTGIPKVIIYGPAGTVLTTVGGNQLQVDTTGFRITYSAAIFGYAPPATPTDLFTIRGPSAKVARIVRIWIAGRATATSWYRLSLLKYSAAFSAGTPGAVTAVPHESGDGAALVVVNTWTALPTVGTLIGTIHDDNLALNAAALTATQPFGPTPGLLYDFGIRNAKPLILKTPSQYLALNGQGAALPAGAVFDIKVEWTEE